MLLTILGRKIDRSLFISKDKQNDIKRYEKFLKQYKHYDTYILVDSEQTEMVHQSIPILQNILEINRVEQFINEQYNPTDIVAYNIFNNGKQTGEVWQTTIARTPFNLPLSMFIDYCMTKSM